MADHVHRVTVRIKNNNHVLFSGSYMDDVQKNLSPDPLAQLGLAKTDAHAGAVTVNGSGVKLQELKDASFLTEA